MKGFNRAQAEYEARLPEEAQLITGKVEACLTDGLFDGIEVEIDYELRDELTIYEVTAIETGETIDPDEITERDRERIAEKVIELKQFEEHYGN